MKTLLDLLKLAAVALFIAAVVGGGCWYQVARWRECRRVHPFWYCATGNGK